MPLTGIWLITWMCLISQCHKDNVWSRKSICLNTNECLTHEEARRNQPIKKASSVTCPHIYNHSKTEAHGSDSDSFTVCVWGRKNRGTDKQNPFPLMFIPWYLIQSSFRTEINHCRSFCFWVITQSVTFRESWKNVHYLSESLEWRYLSVIWITALDQCS